MGNIPSPKQLINAELATRAFNTKAKDMLKRHTPKDVQDDLIIDFQCECSDKDCQERVPMTLDRYEQLHKNHAQFVLAPGHHEPKVETTVKKQADFTVVEKYAL